MNFAEKLTKLVKYRREAIASINAIKEKIVENGVEVAEGTKARELANKIPQVYEAGKKAEYDEFWDTFQDNGNRTDYNYVFAGIGWIEENFKPKYDIVPLTASGMFQVNSVLNGDIDEIIKKLGIKFDTSKCTVFTNFANSAVGVTKLPPLDFTSVTTEMGNTNTFSYCNRLVELEITIKDTTPFSNATFNRCSALQKLIINGTIGQKNFNVQWSTLLTHDSLMSIINALADKTGDTSGTEWSITIGSENKAKLSTTELDIAYNKGWQVN